MYFLYDVLFKALKFDYFIVLFYAYFIHFLFVRYLGRFAVFCGHHAPVLLLLDVKNQKALCHGTQ